MYVAAEILYGDDSVRRDVPLAPVGVKARDQELLNIWLVFHDENPRGLGPPS